jgi:hypothetical protein
MIQNCYVKTGSVSFNLRSSYQRGFVENIIFASLLFWDVFACGYPAL